MGRTLHLIDVENLIGGASFTMHEAEAVAQRYGPVAGLSPQDLVILASSHVAAPAAWFGWPAGRRLLQSGPDGADLALIEVLMAENVNRRFSRVVIASGDGIFSGPSAWLQAMGCAITVVTRRDALSRRLALAVRDVRFLGTEPEGNPNIALARVA